VHTWDKSRDGVAGRGGVGAVMGSKHLKAIALKGSRKTTVADPEAMKTLLNDTRETMKVGTAGLKNYGTTILVNVINKIGALGVRNLQTEVYDKADTISGETFKAAYFAKTPLVFAVRWPVVKIFMCKRESTPGRVGRCPSMKPFLLWPQCSIMPTKALS
jgi:aldehyde:ferredoxin oxidoreductase